MIYFDNAATTSVHPEVVSAYTRLLTEYGNPDSLHQAGRSAKKKLEESRSRIAKMLGVKPEEILFTSCASESNTQAIIGGALANQSRGKHVITSNAEHSSSEHAFDCLESIGFEVTRLPIGKDGRIDPEELKRAIRTDTTLVSLIHVSNEMGAINDLKTIASIVHRHPTCLFHADCTQSFGKLDIPFEDLDLMTMSAHKIHGLKGSALLLKKAPVRVQPVIFGGQQEQGLRGGTENAPVNTVLAKTIRLAMQEKEQGLEDKVRKIRDYIAGEVEKMPGAKVLTPEEAVPYILNIVFDQITSEVLMNALDARGVCVSAKSTCSSREAGGNPVLKKMGCSDMEAAHAIRLSFSGQNTMKEAQEFIRILKEIIQQYGLQL